MTVARWPGTIPRGSRSQQVSVTMDWTATMLALAGAKSPRSLDGMDLMPALSGKTSPVSRTLAWRIAQRRSEGAYRKGDWKFLRNDRGEFLYDLSRDPGEKTDRRVTDAARFTELSRAFASWERGVLAPVGLDSTRR